MDARLLFGFSLLNIRGGRKQISGLDADVVTLAEDREMLNIPDPQFIAFE